MVSPFRCVILFYRKSLTMQQAEEEQIEREAEPVGCPTASPHLLHILGHEPKESA
ncbi:MAG: hypothetical protein ACJ788_19275 [Ktedonobacteraceae bacterium]